MSSAATGVRPGSPPTSCPRLPCSPPTSPNASSSSSSDQAARPHEVANELGDWERVSRSPAGHRQSSASARRAHGRGDALRRELADAREQQTAAAEMLQVINSSPGDLAPVFAAMLEKAINLCAASFGLLMRCDGDALRTVAHHNSPPKFIEFHQAPVHPAPGMANYRILRGGDVVTFVDIAVARGVWCRTFRMYLSTSVAVLPPSSPQRRNSRRPRPAKPAPGRIGWRSGRLMNKPAAHRLDSTFPVG